MSSSFTLLFLIVTCCCLPGADLIKASDKKLTKDYHEKTDSLCILAPDRGPCKRLLKRWYWNSTAELCKVFTFGGCEGNLNRFESQVECLTLCQTKYSTSTEEEKNKRLLEARAKVNSLAEEEKKRLEAKKRRLAKDKAQKGREKVVKNKHRKKKKKEKERGNQIDEDDKPKKIKSKTALEVPAVCLLKPDKGGGCDTPDQGKYWFHYDATTAKCFKFWYWGCGGNLNRFETNHKCLKKCIRSTEIRLKNHKRHCDKCDYKTSTCHKVARGNFTCHCMEGFKKNFAGSCVDEDECLAFKADCSPYAWCENSIGSYRCVCMDGYRGTGKLCERIPFNNQVFQLARQTTADVNECMGEPPACPDHSTCHNTIGSFFCECHVGYGGGGKICSNNPTICTQPFDERYKRQCGTGQWSVRYFYNQTTANCERFWYDQCQLTSMNIFSDPQTCQALCARKMRRARDETSSSRAASTPTAVACSDEFDVRNMEQCQKASWTPRYYFDRRVRRCQMFWYDASCDDQTAHRETSSRNYFPQLITCQWMCEAKVEQMPQIQQPHQSMIHGRRHSSIGSTGAYFSQKSQQMQQVTIDQADQPRYSSRYQGSNREQQPQIQQPQPKHNRVSWNPVSIGQISASFSSKKTQDRKDNRMPPHIGVISASFSSTKDARKPVSPVGPSPSPIRFGKVTASLSSYSSGTTQPKSNKISFGRISAFISPAPSFLEAKEKPVGVFDPVGEVKATKIDQMLGSPVGPSPSPIRFGKITASLSPSTGTQPKSNRISFGRVSAFISPSPSFLEVREKPVDVFDPVGQVRATITDQMTSSKSSMKRRSEEVVRPPTAEAIADNQVFSVRYKAAITVAVDCLDPFDDILTRSCGSGQWQSRYYFDPDQRRCRMYWFDNCKSHSRNNFGDLESCQWMCEGTHPKPEAKACLDAFDEIYKQDCRNGKFESRFYFDHDSKQCQLFWFGGCQSRSKNFFADVGVCQNLCETPNRDLSRSCLDPFDPIYEQLCSSSFQQKYYFDIRSKSCKLFWYGHCKGTSENIYPSLATCQWLCERPKSLEPPKHCIDKFDEKYSQSCAGGDWEEKWYFDHKTGECESFWYDQCKSTSENIFPDRKTCQWLCELPSPPYIAPSHIPDVCLEDVQPGTCGHHYPAYHYNRQTARCEPFSYTGCGGNRNRFLTVKQCEQTCEIFTNVNGHDADCLLPLDVGHGRQESQCIRDAGYKFYYNRDYGKCGRFWYFGCGGNENRFNSDAVCRVACGQNHHLLESSKYNDPSVCFMPEDKGSCQYIKDKPVQRWSYNAATLSCQEFTYNGCDGNRNRFGSQRACEMQCQGLKRPNADLCAYWPDWGPCNQLRWMWFYNMTRGSCDQFLWGGCEGNTNRFSSFETCQQTCEISGSDPCSERLDRGKWCESMSNRYYFDTKTKKCKGFHYTGCGQSANNFMTLSECQSQCVFKTVVQVEPSTKESSENKYSGIKPLVKNDMKRHVFLSDDSQSYLKTEAQWVDYGQCMGFRFNISGVFTRLTSYLCLMEENGHCMTEILTDTKGEEKCKVVRPWLRGHHLYSWFFTVDKLPRHWTDYPVADYQHKNETVASILLLALNNCWNVC